MRSENTPPNFSAKERIIYEIVITSDNATIAAPAGVVVVAIEGEDAVKAIVK